MKINKIIYYTFTVIFTLIIMFSAGMYFFNHDFIKQAFTNLGYPTYLIYPYATAKILGVIAIWQTKFMRIKEWAYSAFFFAIILAFSAHIMTNDGGEAMSIIALVSLVVSYLYYRIVRCKSLN